MKKTICLVMASIMALALVACGGNSADKDGTDSVVSVTSETTPAAASESAPAESTQEPAKDIQSEGTHLYDNATVKAVMNGTRTEKIGEYSIIKANSEDCTVDALTDWYFNYVKKNNFNFCMILYSDKTDNSGCYSIPGMVQKDIQFDIDENGDYSVGDSSNATSYVSVEEGKLQALDNSN